uniref:Uncharacterized protein n=1 Tax=Oryza rufipogon TaxID=4529 RepID=A0A0E0P6K9_ORYRU
MGKRTEAAEAAGRATATLLVRSRDGWGFGCGGGCAHLMRQGERRRPVLARGIDGDRRRRRARAKGSLIS